MFVRDLFFSCLRRWYFLVLGLIATGVLTYFAFGLVLPNYEAKASAVLIPPAVAVTVGDNPYLYLGGLEQALGVLQVKASSPEVAEPLLKKYPDSTIVISKDPTTSGPIMAITVTAATPEDTMALLKASLALISATLDALQKDQNVPAPSIITSMPLSIDVEPTQNAKKQIQLTAIAAVGGLAATLLLTGLLDRFMSRPKKMRKTAAAENEDQSFGPRLLVDGDTGDSEASRVGAAKKSRRADRKRAEADQEEGLVEREESADVGT